MVWWGVSIDQPSLCHGFETPNKNSRVQSHHVLLSRKSKDSDLSTIFPDAANSSSRRQILMAMTATVSLVPLACTAQTTSQPSSLEDLALGRAHWAPLGPSGRSVRTSHRIPASFCTYLARFLITFDAGVASWWQGQVESVKLLSPDQQQRRLEQSFGKFAASLLQALETYLQQSTYESLLQRLLGTYPDKDVPRHIGILCALLPDKDQPTGPLRQHLIDAAIPSKSPPTSRVVSPNDMASVLPTPYHIIESRNSNNNNNHHLIITPPLSLDQVATDVELGSTAIATPFGPLASEVLTRELPSYTLPIYTILGLSGATGCAFTHSLVIPLDVVKTKAQTNPEEYSNIIQGAGKIIREEGWSGLLTGAEATLAGYFWYGLSVYPSYTFFKRYLGNTLCSSDWSVAHGNTIALVAGALAAVVASLGLTPLEAARIRVVADPQKYKSMGLGGTLQAIADDKWTRLYAGLPSLLTRQVIFGSVKFLAFERACDAIYHASPSLRDSTWTTLGVSLIAGGFSGALSSVVSQPADSVLTYVSKSDGDLTVLEASQVMVKEGGVGSLFRGLGSRCLWAGSIIAGQFLLYDVFRSLFGVTTNDLSQVFRVDI